MVLKSGKNPCGRRKYVPATGTSVPPGLSVKLPVVGEGVGGTGVGEAIVVTGVAVVVVPR